MTHIPHLKMNSLKETVLIFSKPDPIFKMMHYDDVKNRYQSNDKPASRPFLGIMFECCSVYARIYKNKEGTAYEGHCPKCMKPIRIRVGKGGSSNRFFKVS